MKNLYGWFGNFLILTAALLTANNLFFATNPAAALPLFIYVDVLVLAGFAMVLADGFRGHIDSSEKNETYQLMIFVFGITGHLYAYNTLAKVSSSGLENTTLWLLLDPVVMALFIYRGLQRKREHGLAASSCVSEGIALLVIFR